jgi:signal transduction histidine kinase
MVGSTTDPEPLPEDTAPRMSDFTELLATAIENSESREGLQRLAEEQAALRRVATLVAEGVSPAKVFSALCEEVNRLVDAQATTIGRLEPDGRVEIVATAGTVADRSALGMRLEPDAIPVTAAVLKTGRPARRDDYSDVVKRNQMVRDLGIRSGVGVPIVVDGALWGAIGIGTVHERFPQDTEQRLEKFTELAATAIGNAANRGELEASRARIVTAADETRRRIERDLHDGAQQRLVSLELGLRAAEADIPPDRAELRAELSRVAGGLAEAVEELRELSRGIHPAILSEGGLAPALRTLARRSRIPLELETRVDRRLPERIEVAAYYVASEALTNATKHAHASVVRVDLREQSGTLRLSIRDDGIGGVDLGRGSGLVGLRDRVEALGGKITIDSAPGTGTSLVATLPIDDETASAAE